MKIYFENKLKNLKEIVQQKAKYQKVMLLFDESVSNLEISEIYNEIKDCCVYNQSNILDIKEDEIFDGYRLVIYLTLVDNFLKCKFDRSEFINVYIHKDGAMLPYFLSTDNKLNNDENFLLADNLKIDLSMISSVYFNKFYNYFRNLMLGETFYFDFNFSTMEITQSNVLNLINQLDMETKFLDVEILREQNIEYGLIVFVDLMIIDAILLLITSIKNHNFMLVDVYKSAKEDCEMIEKFYKLYNNDVFINLVQLNYNCLYNYCVKTKEKIIEFTKFFKIDTTQVASLLNQIKIFSKNDNDIMAYLYLYNIFNV